MADNELHYLTYDPEAMWREMQLAYVEAGGDPLYPGDEKEMLLRSVQACMVQAFAGVDNALRMSTLRYATGEYLDIIGENRGCERRTGTYARAYLRLHVFPWNYSTPYVLPAGSLFETPDKKVQFRTDVTASLTEDFQTIPVTATEPGSYANGIQSGLAMMPVDNKCSSVTMDSTSMGGYDDETDDDYRERIRTYMLSNVTTGTKTQIENAVIESNAGVITDAYAQRSTAGNDDEVNVFITVDEPHRDNIQIYASAAQEAVNTSDTLPIGMRINAQASPIRQYAFKVQVNRESVSEEEIQGIIDSYRHWQENKVGRPFNPERLIGDLYRAGCSSVFVAVMPGNTFSTLSFTKINPNEHCEGTVTVTYTTTV